MSQTDFSITIGIPTFNRADHLQDLLQQFEKLASLIDINTTTIVVSNNASSDNTQDVLDNYSSRLTNAGYKISFYRQENNLGMDGNFRFIYDKCDSLYLWYCGDDDILILENIDELFYDLKKIMPDVCLSNFIQPPYSDRNSIFLSDSDKKSEIISDKKKSIDKITKYPKLTNYIIKKTSAKHYESLINDCEGDYYLFIAYSLLAFSLGEKLLIRSGSVAISRPDYLSIEYSPRAFVGLRRTVNKVLTYLGREYINFVVKEKPSDEMNAALRYLIFHYLGKLNLPSNVLNDERTYIRNNFRYILMSPRNFVKYIIYIISILRAKITGF